MRSRALGPVEQIPVAPEPGNHAVASGDDVAGAERIFRLVQTLGIGGRRVVVEVEQGLDLGAQRRIRAAYGREIGLALGWRQGKRLQKHVFGALVERRHRGIR